MTEVEQEWLLALVRYQFEEGYLYLLNDEAVELETFLISHIEDYDG